MIGLISDKITQSLITESDHQLSLDARKISQGLRRAIVKTLPWKKDGTRLTFSLAISFKSLG